MDKIDKRKMTRECAMQLLYEMEIQNDFSADLKTAFLSRLPQLRNYDDSASRDNGSDYPIETDYFDQAIGAVVSNLTDIDETLINSAHNWKIDRISKVDLSILRLSIAETQFMNDIPVSVSINEAVELAKKFGGDDSGKFVNGVLGKAAKGNNA